MELFVVLISSWSAMGHRSLPEVNGERQRRMVEKYYPPAIDYKEYRAWPAFD
jgi:hypothetical protein